MQPRYIHPPAEFAAHAERLARARLLTSKELAIIRGVAEACALLTYGDMPSYFHYILSQVEGKIPSSKLDSLMVSIFQELLTNLSVDFGKPMTTLLAHAIHTKLHELANLLLDSGFCDLTEPHADGYTCLTRVLYKDIYDAALFQKILASEYQLINHKEPGGFTALMLAMTYKDKSILLRLMEYPHLEINDANICQILHINDKVLTARLIQFFNEKNVDDSMYFSGLLPVAWLQQKYQNEIREFVIEFIAEEPVFIDNPELAEAILSFLNDKNPLPFANMNRLSIVYCLINYLHRPERVHQYTANMCGLVCVMQHAIMVNPATFVRSVLDVVQSAATGKFGKSAVFLAELWQEVMRDRYNTVLGYKATSPLAPLIALTRPDQLVSMYRDMGFAVINETFQIRMCRNTKPGQFFDEIRQRVSSKKNPSSSAIRVYSDAHVELQNDGKRFDELCRLAENNCYITILVTLPFVDQYIEQSGKSVNHFLGIFEMSHYMVINQFTYNQADDTVSFNCLTWGRSRYLHNIPRKDFEPCYLGALGTTFEVSLQNRLA